jgi:hypothetical protein
MDDDRLDPAGAPRRAADSVEWLAALWELAEGRDSRCANPGLLTLLRFTPGWSAHPAMAAVASERRRNSRDLLIKAIVRDTYGEPTSAAELRMALEDLAARSNDIVGPGPCQVVAQARAEAERRVEAIAGRLDPAADLAAVTGEHVQLQILVAPSVFLPPPQSGRHGVLLRRADHWVAHLHFGFPLEGVVEAFDINRPWLLGGAWHYAIDIYLQRHWPPIAERLADRRDLAEAVSAAMESSRGGEGAARGAWSWIDALRAHVGVAFKCLLSRRQGLPDGIHRALARASGLSLFPWFESWLIDAASGGHPLDTVLQALPEALTQDRPAWESLGRAAGLPPTVNLALISPAARRASLVVPDDWSDDDATAAVAGWRLLPLPVVRHGEWLRASSGGTPVIAFGDPARNPLVGRVLAQRGLALEALEATRPAIIALSASGFEGAPWCIAVAVQRPETAATLHMEMALKQTSTYVLLDGPVVIGAQQVAISDLAPPGPLASSARRAVAGRDGVTGEV